VIPTILLPSFLIGRWWTIPIAAVLWTVLLLATGTIGAADIPLAAGLGAANAAVGVVVHQVLRSLFGLRPRRAPTEGSSPP
jgi:Flp pilus assembly protein protease CpaA